MQSLSKTLKMALLSGLFITGTGLATATSAMAGDYGNAVSERVYCDRDGDHCYRVRRSGDAHYRDGGDYGRDDYYRSDHQEYRDEEDRYADRYRDDRSYDRDDRYVCDSDGDRCYNSRDGYWDYREYYRRLGYHWND